MNAARPNPASRSRPGGPGPHAAWCLARILAGRTLNGELSRVEGRFRPLADGLNRTPVEGRRAAFDGACLAWDQAEVEALTRAICDVDPEGPEPAEADEDGGAAPPGPDVDYAAMSDEDLGILPLSSVKAKPIDWLWPYRLARGEMALVAGEGGLGKSQILLAIAAAMSTGSEWPDGSGTAPIGRTIILAAEDSPETTIKPRLMAMGADIDRITILRSRYRIQRDGKPPLVNPVVLSDIPYWQTVLAKLQDARLIIVDPLPSYLGRGINDSKNNELRAAVEPFIEEIVRPRGICMLSNSHLNKSNDSRSPIHRVNGSVAYANLARNVHFVVRDPDDPAHRVFKQAKCNNAPDDLPAIGFRVEARLVVAEAGEIEAAVPIFDAETMQIDLHEAMTSDKGAGKRGPAPSRRVDLAKWLVAFLKDRGPVLLAEIIESAGEAGFLGAVDANGRYVSRNNLYRAREHVPKLSEPDDGWEIATSKEDDSLLSTSGKHRWLLRASGPSS